ncbi:MAG: hypothetical protein Q9164_007891, partial [Protoblastenia rupestris]
IDRFLFGHPSGYPFNSPNQFAPHAIWLAAGKEGQCFCVACIQKSKNGRSATSLSILPRIVHNNRTTPSTNVAAPQERIVNETALTTTKDSHGPVLTKLLTELRTVKEMNVFIEESDDFVS